MRRLCLAVGVAASCGQALGADPHEAGALIEAMRAAEPRIENYSATVDVTLWTKAPDAADFTLTNRHTAVLTVDQRGRLKFEMKGFRSTVGGVREGETVTRGSFNGEVYKEEVGGAGAPRRGTLAADAGGVVWGVAPDDCLWGYLGRPVSAILREHGIETLDPVPGEPEQVVVTTRPVPHDDGFVARYRFTVDRRAGFACPVKEALLRRGTSDAWVTYHAIRGADYREVGQNIWAPSRVTTELLSVPPGDGPAQPFLKGEVAITNVSVNAVIGDDFFEMRFTDRTTVTDRRNGKVLRAISRQKATAAEIARAGEEYFIEDELKAELRYTRRSRLLAGVTVVAVVAALGLAWWFIRGRRSNLPAARHPPPEPTP